MNKNTSHHSKRLVYYISDSTGITARAFGHSLLTQFEHDEFDEVTIPYVDTPAKADDTIEQINRSYQRTQLKPLVFATMIDPEILKKIQQSHCLLLDFFHSFIGPLEAELQMESSHSIGKAHGVQDKKAYIARIEAIDYTFNSDDGNNIKNYAHADFILLGVSRCGKTPTSLYMALQFGIKVANYPFIDDDLRNVRLPNFLIPHKEKLFGLTIDPKRLHMIRTERRAGSQYADIAQCRKEITCIEQLYKQQHIPYLNTTTRSIEEISTMVVNQLHLQKVHWKN